MKRKNKPTKPANLFADISGIIEKARQQIASVANLAMVYAYYEIGRHIVEDEQQGKKRAEYGKQVLTELANKLTEKFGKGFSFTNLNQMRQFFLAYSAKANQILQTPSEEFNPKFILSWSHYLILMRIEKVEERRFYEIESAEQQWSVSQLSRQYHSSLYERLSLSRNKNKVMQLASKGQEIETAKDLLKNPLVLEFVGLKEESAYSETDLETAIIGKLQDFLLELGKGFLFEARQKRFTFDEQHFFVDLVFYNRLLQCYVLIDLKTSDLKHQDLGQMQMYVNYFDRYVKKDFEKPTVGILLCKKKTENIVKLTLPENANIYATEYNLYLPDKSLLQQKLVEWTEEFNALEKGN
ncbi:hypothetical protein AGMMS49938_07960 [Fibrobacterales bacterium]|nr:hypothetical protein AGMMS49938_07960 [Fibrobacterales bacterium]